MAKGERVLVSVLVLPSVKAELARAAAEEGRSLSDMGQRFILAGLAAKAKARAAEEQPARELVEA
jgi:hypothetical protein